MTNADKYLKDEVDVKQLSREMFNFLVNDDIPLKIHIELFFAQPIKPTLTEDEKVILRNIKDGYITIARDKAGELFIATERDENSIRGHNALEFKHDLFQFIKNGEEYKISDLLEE